MNKEASSTAFAVYKMKMPLGIASATFFSKAANSLYIDKFRIYVRYTYVKVTAFNNDRKSSISE